MFHRLYTNLLAKRDRWQNEEEVRIGWITELANSLDLELHAERGRRDLSYNNVVIEFKDRGLFRGKITSPAFEEAMNRRLEPYITRLASDENLEASDYIGIAIDGDHICFAQVRDGSIIHGPLMPFTEASVTMVALSLRESYRRAVSADNLAEDFGHASGCGVAMMTALAKALEAVLQQEDAGKIKMLFVEWQSLFGQVADLSTEQSDSIRRSLRFTLETAENLRTPAILFVIHTYNSIVIKLLAAEIVSSHGLTSYRHFAQVTAVLDDARLANTLENEIERGQFYARAGIHGFAEEAIFSWYLEANEKLLPAILQSVRTMLVQLALYRTDRLTNARSTDIVKRFYQDLVPSTLRKSLGEFYTPDWLVQFTIDKAGERDWLDCRTLDPTCGSGSFLLEVIRRKREAAKLANWDSRRTIHYLMESVWGFDLNPLAVLSARINVLIAIADLLQSVPGEQIELPILLADAIYSPAGDPEGNEAVVAYQVGSKEANLEVTLPVALAFDRKRLDRVFEIMGEAVSENAEYPEAAQRLISSGGMSAGEEVAWREPIQATYDRVLGLHRGKWNGIWFLIIRNYFWSATAGRFDLVAGNPPWIRWSKLPELYRERVKPTCERYAIFSSTPYHGGNELDISAIIAYAVADKWLRTGGDLTFVITQTHFQSPSSEGFRSFHIDDRNRLIPKSIDDMKALKPFPDAANKTSVALFRKEAGTEPHYPVPYFVWDTRPSYSATIPVDLSTTDVLARIQATRMEATPATGGTSPWCILPPGRFSQVVKLAGNTSGVNGRKGITSDLNGIYFVEVLETNTSRRLVKIATRPESGRRDIGPQQEFWIEPDLLYPLLKGASDFSACRIHRSHALYALVPNTGITRHDYDEALRRMNSDLPNTKRYFATYKTPLEARSTYKTRMPNAPYFAVYNVGDYTFASWKVIWAEQKEFCSAVLEAGTVPLIGRRCFVPDHKIFFVEFADKDEAFFLCGILNAPLVKEFIECHTISIQLGNIFKHMRVPSYDASNEEHTRLATACQKAHNASDDKHYLRLLSEMRQLAERILA